MKKFRAYPRHTINGRIDLFIDALALLLGGQALCGDNVRRFEEEFAGFCQVPYALGVESARKGLYLILQSRDFEKGSEVIMPAYTFSALAVVVMACGLKPVFVDVDPVSHNIDPTLIEPKISGKTKAIIVTHMFGFPVDMDAVMAVAGRHNLFVVEDCAHACGSKYKGRRTGSLGHAAIFSFKMGKIMPCFGGGMVTTSDQQLQRSLREAVERFPYPKRSGLLKEIVSTFIFFCTTSRYVFPWLTYPLIRLMDAVGSDLSDHCIEESIDIKQTSESLENQKRFANLQASIGLKQLKRLDASNAILKDNARKLISALKGIPGVGIPADLSDREVPYLYFRICVADARMFRKKLLMSGIDTKRDDMNACSSLKVFSDSMSVCPVAERLHRESIEIPHNLFLNDDDINYISAQVRITAEAVSGGKAGVPNEHLTV